MPIARNTRLQPKQLVVSDLAHGSFWSSVVARRAGTPWLQLMSPANSYPSTRPALLLPHCCYAYATQQQVLHARLQLVVLLPATHPRAASLRQRQVLGRAQWRVC